VDVQQFELTRAGTVLRGEVSGAGPPIVLAHGLTATRRYVVMGSSALQRTGHRVIAYDARGHGASAPAADGSYDYASLGADLLAVMDHVGLETAVLVGASMGAHTAARVAIEHPGRVAALAALTPAFAPDGDRQLAQWDALAEGLRHGGAAGFLAAYDFAALPEPWRETIRRVVRQRLDAQQHPQAVADALERVPRSQPFSVWHELATVSVPALVVASRDEIDPGHRLAVGERWAAELPAGQLAVEEPGAAPLAWQGGRVSALVAELAARAAD